MPSKLTLEEFIKRAERKYGVGTYGYYQVVYVNSYTKVKIPEDGKTR